MTQNRVIDEKGLIIDHVFYPNKQDWLRCFSCGLYQNDHKRNHNDVMQKYMKK